MTDVGDTVRAALVPTVLWVFGIYCVLLGAWQIVSPGTFFELVGPFGERNDHYTRDAATFELANAVLLLAAVRWRSWALAALVFTTVRFGLHTLNHLWDVNRADPQWVGVADLVALAVATGWLLATLWALRESRSEAGPAAH